VGKGRDKGVRVYALVRDRCVKGATVSKVRFVGVAREDYAGRVGVRSAHIRMRGLRPLSN